MKRVSIIFSSLIIAFLMSSCEDDPKPDNVYDEDSKDAKGTSDTDTDSDSDSDSDADTDADSDSDSDTDDDVCNEQDFNIDAAPVRLMILIDLSGSMDEGNPTKWQQAKQAMTTVLNSYGADLEFGFDRFPNNIWCGVDNPVVYDSVPDNAQNIINKFNNLSPVGSTPLFLAMKKFLEDDYAPEFTAQNATSYLLVVSDGEDVCGPDGNPVTGATKPAQFTTLTTDLCNKGIKTYVIGFGSGVEPTQLDAIAQAGCTGESTYIDADNQQQLEDAMDSLAASVISCVYEIEKPPEGEVDENDVNFYFDGDVVGKDDGCAQEKGWTWTDDTHTRVEFCKEACEELQAGEVDKISATFGCPSIPID